MVYYIYTYDGLSCNIMDLVQSSHPKLMFDHFMNLPSYSINILLRTVLIEFKIGEHDIDMNFI